MTKIAFMTLFNPGDVLLIRFPFTDLSSSKKRPAVAISTADFAMKYGDMVVLALTSRPQEDAFRLEDWREAGLLKPTWGKPLIGTISLSLAEARLGTLSSRDKQRVMCMLDTIVPRG